MTSATSGKNFAAAAIVVEPSERTEVIEHKNIGEAFLAIMGEVGYVQKKGVNTHQKYKYAGEAQLIEALRPVMLKHKVICIPSEAKSRETVVVTDDGKKTYRTIIDYTFVYTHVPSGTHLQVQVIGEGVDTGDKSAYKAATGALKYALRQPFLIETGDEPEAHDLPEDKKKPERNLPTSGGVSAAEEFGSGPNFRKYHAETMGYIDNMISKDQAAAISKRIQRVRKVDDGSADALQDALSLKLDGMHLQGQ